MTNTTNKKSTVPIAELYSLTDLLALAVIDNVPDLYAANMPLLYVGASQDGTDLHYFVEVKRACEDDPDYADIQVYKMTTVFIKEAMDQRVITWLPSDLIATYLPNLLYNNRLSVA